MLEPANAVPTRLIERSPTVHDFTRRASRHSTWRPEARRPCTSQGVIAPVSTPTFASDPACLETTAEIFSGCVRQSPLQIRLPSTSTTQMAVIFCETSNPTECDIGTSNVARHRAKRPDRNTIGKQLDAAITRGPQVGKRIAAFLQPLKSLLRMERGRSFARSLHSLAL